MGFNTSQITYRSVGSEDAAQLGKVLTFVLLVSLLGHSGIAGTFLTTTLSEIPSFNDGDELKY